MQTLHATRSAVDTEIVMIPLGTSALTKYLAEQRKVHAQVTVSYSLSFELSVSTIYTRDLAPLQAPSQYCMRRAYLKYYPVLPLLRSLNLIFFVAGSTNTIECR